jgi:hypothetical protein
VSPFISASRRVRRRPSPRVVALALAAGLFVFTVAGPAFGGPSVPSAANALSTAKKALKLAKKAESDAKKSPVGSGRLVNGAVVTSKIANGAVRMVKITAGAVGTDRLADGAVTTGKLADGAVTASKLGANAVGSANIQNGSVSLSDISGADVTGPVDIDPIPARTCEILDLQVPGAQVGQFPIMAFEGNTALPDALIAIAIKVSAAGTVRSKVCNPTDTATSATTGVGVRVITLN